MQLKSFHALLYIKRKQQYNIVSYLRVGKEAVSTRKKKKTTSPITMPTKYKRKHKCEFCGKFLSGRSSFWNHIYVYKCRERVSWNKCDSCNWLLNINQQWISDINIIFQKKKKATGKGKIHNNNDNNNNQEEGHSNFNNTNQETDQRSYHCKRCELHRPFDISQQI